MPVPSSGQLRLRADINLEVNGNDTDDNVSLGTLSNEAGFTEPDTMSEFYGYTSVVAPTVSSNAAYNVNQFGCCSCVATIEMTLNDDGGETIYASANSSSKLRLYYSTSSNPVSSGNFAPIGSSQLTGGSTGQTGSTYRITLYNLSFNTQYYYQFWAENSAGSSSSSLRSFTTPLPTLDIIPSTTQTPVSWVTNFGGGGTGQLNCCNGTSDYAYFNDLTYRFSNYSAQAPYTIYTGWGGSGCNSNQQSKSYTGSSAFIQFSGWGTFLACSTCSPYLYYYATKSGYQTKNFPNAYPISSCY